jgi:hypothetical protein
MLSGFLVEIYAWSIIWNFFDLTQPQRPLTEKVLKFHMSFGDSAKRFFFSKQQNKVLKLLNSRIWKTLKSSVVIFQALENSSSNWPHRPLQPHRPQQPLNANFLENNSDLDGLIITSTKITNTDHFLWNGSPKIQFFSNIRHSFWGGCWGQVRFKKVSNDESGINFHYSGSHWASVFDRFFKTSGQARSLHYVKT